MDQATQTAALNADLLVELLSHSSGPQKRESTAANLLPANGEHYAQVRYHLSCTGCKPLSCIGHAPSLTHRSRTIFPAQLTHHLSCTGHAPSLMHRSRFIFHAQVTHHLSCTGHAPSLMQRLHTIPRAQVVHDLSRTRHAPSPMHGLPHPHSSSVNVLHKPIFQPAQSMPSARHTTIHALALYTTIHASALKTCVLVRVLAHFAPKPKHINLRMLH